MYVKGINIDFVSVEFWILFPQCGILELFPQCGILELFRYCGILCLSFYSGILLNVWICFQMVDITGFFIQNKNCNINMKTLWCFINSRLPLIFMYHCTSYVHHRVSLQTDYGFGILIFFVTSLINIKFNVSQKDVSLANVGYPV
jgi:hypothetical protein